MQHFLDEYIIPTIFGISAFVVSVFGWIFNRQTSKIDKVSEELETHKLHAANNYATHADIDDLKEGLYARWDRLEDKVDGFLKTVATAVSHTELKEATDQLHARINELQKIKLDK